MKKEYLYIGLSILAVGGLYWWNNSKKTPAPVVSAKPNEIPKVSAESAIRPDGSLDVSKIKRVVESYGNDLRGATYIYRDDAGNVYEPQPMGFHSMWTDRIGDKQWTDTGAYMGSSVEQINQMNKQDIFNEF